LRVWPDEALFVRPPKKGRYRFGCQPVGRVPPLSAGGRDIPELDAGAAASGAARFGGMDRGCRTSNAGFWFGSHVGPNPLALKR
jgi:hypothetical protein